MHHRVAAGDLRDIQRAIAGFMNFLERTSRRDIRHTDRNRHRNRAAAGGHRRCADRSSDLVGDAGAFETIETAQRDREFLATDPCDLVERPAKSLQQQVADAANDVVTGLMSEHLVDILELIDIDQQQHAVGRPPISRHAA